MELKDHLTISDLNLMIEGLGILAEKPKVNNGEYLAELLCAGFLPKEQYKKKLEELKNKMEVEKAEWKEQILLLQGKLITIKKSFNPQNRESTNS